VAKKPRAEAAENKTPGILPVPGPVIAHHAPTLEGPMREWALSGHVPPTLLLTGTAGSGKRHLAYWLAQWILCERSGFAKPGYAESGVDDSGEVDMFSGSLFGAEAPTEVAAATTPSRAAASKQDGPAPGPCGECASCKKAVQGNWVDFTEVLPEDSDGATAEGGTLKVDQFRKIKSTLGFGAHEGAYRIVLIPNADRMTLQAANSVLKLLEEPPPGWIFFLTASDPTLVLPTILSRCQSLRLRPFQPETIRELLDTAGIEPERADICSRLAQGSWTKAVKLAEPMTWDHRDVLFRFLKEPASELSALVDWASASNPQFELLVDQLEQLTSELIRWSVVGRPAESYAWNNADGRGSLVFHANATTKSLGGTEAARDFWIARAERLARVRQESLAPLNRKILVQDLLLPWLAS
jgi:hypothetical protein